MNIIYKSSFNSDLKRIKNKKIAVKIKEFLIEFYNYETIFEANDIKKIKGSDNFYRIRINDYRLGICYDNNNAIFVRVLPRKDFYGKFPE